MKRTTILRVLPALLLTLAATAATAKPAGDLSKLPPAGYDETRDPAADLKAAVVQAQQENKRILLEVGGEWCIYCRVLNKLIHDDERLTQRLHDGFVVIKVNFSEKEENEDFLSHYPKIPSYPHLFLLESDGALLLSKNPDDFMDGDEYVPELILAFLETWAPKGGAGKR
ncbi:MAG TPA: thiol-disulfide isomerase [Acidobacteria bacterium]|nr:thiol-disulfide isomerase [Acidobacteriota bacterium]